VETGESEYPAVLKTRNLLIFRDAQNAEIEEIAKFAPNWNVSGTRDFSVPEMKSGRQSGTRHKGKSETLKTRARLQFGR
jgi:hypothetical protein